ncbi:MAG: lysylphosphatidylglycerol synthase domain-containing protein [Candidatus Zixiibacteriota bacterium]
MLIFHAGILKTFRRFIHIFGLDRFHRIDTIYEKLSLAVKNVREFKYINLFPVVFYTILIWTFSFFVFYILFVGMGLRLNFWNIALGASITIIINFFPIRGLGGFGTVEGAWTVGFMLAGLSASEAISSGFSIHILRIIFLLILGFTGYALRWRERVIKSKARSLSKYSDVMKEGCTNASDS